MSKELNQLLNDNIFKHYFTKTYQHTNYEQFQYFNEQTKISFLIKLYLYISNKDCEQLAFQSINPTYQDLSNKQDTEEAETIKTHLNAIINKYQLPDPLSFHNELIINSNQTNYIDDLIWSTTQLQIKRPHSKSYSKINYDPMQVEKIEEIQSYVIDSRFLFEQCNEAKINPFKEPFQSIKNTINSNDDNIAHTIKRCKKQINHPNKNDGFYLVNYKALSNPSIKSIGYQTYSIFEDINKRGNTFFSTNLSKIKKESSKDYCIINQSLSESATLFLEHYKDKDVMNRLFNCPSNSYITLDSNEVFKINQMILQLLHSEDKRNNMMVLNSKANKDDITDKYNELLKEANELKEQLKQLLSTEHKCKELMIKHTSIIETKVCSYKDQIKNIEELNMIIDQKTETALRMEILQRIETSI